MLKDQTSSKTDTLIMNEEDDQVCFDQDVVPIEDTLFNPISMTTQHHKLNTMATAMPFFSPWLKNLQKGQNLQNWKNRFHPCQNLKNTIRLILMTQTVYQYSDQNLLSMLQQLLASQQQLITTLAEQKTQRPPQLPPICEDKDLESI